MNQIQKDMKIVADLADRMPNALELLPPGYDLTTEEDFIQAGQTLIDLGRKAFIALGELISVKLDLERVGDNFERANELYKRYAAAWGVNRSTVVKALVIADKYHEVDRPLDATPTLVYEILSGSDTPEQAEEGFNTAIAEGWGVKDVRLAKALRSVGLVPREKWEIPSVYFGEDGHIWARDSEGHEVLVMKKTEEDGALARQAVLAIRHKAGI